MSCLLPLLVALHEGEDVVVGVGDEEHVLVEPYDGPDVEVVGGVEEGVLGGVFALVLTRLLDTTALQEASR